MEITEENREGGRRQVGHSEMISRMRSYRQGRSLNTEMMRNLDFILHTMKASWRLLEDY